MLFTSVGIGEGSASFYHYSPLANNDPFCFEIQGESMWMKGSPSILGLIIRSSKLSLIAEGERPARNARWCFCDRKVNESRTDDDDN